MPNPTAGDVHVNGPLTNISIAFIQDAENFIATRMFPNVPVTKQSDSYFIWDRQDFFRRDVARRAPSAESAGGGARLTTEDYNAHVYAIHRDVDDQTRANQDSPLQLDRDATTWVTQQLLMEREAQFVGEYFQASTWTGGTGGATDQTGVAAAPSTNEFLQWNDAASTPIEDIREQIVAMAEKTGFKPNKMAIGPEVWKALVDHPDILDRIKYTQTGIVSMQLIASLLDLDEIMVGWGVEDDSVEGGTAAFDFFWGKSALLTYSPATPSLMHPSAGYTFSWTGFLGAGNMGNRIKSFRLERNAADRIEGEMAFALKVVAPDLGVFFATAVA